VFVHFFVLQALSYYFIYKFFFIKKKNYFLIFHMFFAIELILVGVFCDNPSFLKQRAGGQ